MNKIIQFIKWAFLRTWHIGLPIIFIIFIMFCSRMSGNPRLVFKVGSTSMQIIGVAVLLFVLNQNIMSIKGTSFIGEFQKWWKANPFYKKSYNIRPETARHKVSTYDARVMFKEKGKTIDERITIIEKELDLIRKEMVEDKDEIFSIIQNNKLETDNKIKKIDKTLSQINRLVENVSIGDYRLLIFSSLMVILGLGLSMWPMI